MVRTFVAVEASQAVRARAAELIEQLRDVAAGIKWVEPHNLHITLKFLGDVHRDRIAEVCRAVAQVAAEAPRFELGIVGAGAFPRLDRPRTVWLGSDQGEKEIADLARTIDKALEKLGYPREGRKFQAHLTIGLARQGNPSLGALGDKLRALQREPIGSITVEEVVVFSSLLGPGGPTYQPLGRAPLR